VGSQNSANVYSLGVGKTWKFQEVRARKYGDVVAYGSGGKSASAFPQKEKDLGVKGSQNTCSKESSMTSERGPLTNREEMKREIKRKK